jgi:hypothetical protein
VADDYRDEKKYAERPDPKNQRRYDIPERWWEVKSEKGESDSITGGRVAALVCEAGSSLRVNSENRHQANIQHARLYENCDIDSLSGRDFADSLARQALAGAGMMSLNVGATCVDTLAAKITKNRPRPSFQCDGASWTEQIKARNLDKWCRGYFYETKVYQEANPVFIDGCEFGTGFLQVFPKGKTKKLACERVIPDEMYVDDLDGYNGNPSQLLRHKLVQRDVLLRQWPKFEEEIRTCSKQTVADIATSGDPKVSENMIDVWEAWHLPSVEGAADGKHVICINNCTLFSEQWKIMKFPFVVYRFKRRTTGFYGKGVIETVQPIQVELNRTVRSISLQLKRKGKGRTYVAIGSKVNPNSLTNADGGDIVQYAGEKPSMEVVNAIAPEEFQYALQLRAQALQEVGLSELSTEAKKPSGLDAAVALREMSDIESERFAKQHQAWDQFFLDFAELSIDLITEQYGWKAYEVLVPGRRDLLKVDWAKIDLKRDSYIMQMFPVSSLPQLPGARYAKVKEMMADGFIDKPVAQRLLEFPDIEAESNLGNAMIDDADATISHILDDDEPKLMQLEPYQNLDLIIQRTNASYLYARHRGCPENRLRLLRQLMDNATKMKAALMAPPPMPAMPGAPMGAPGAPAPGGGPTINNTMNMPSAAPAPMAPPQVVQ